MIKLAYVIPIIIIINQICTKSLQITDLNNNPGIFAIKIGKVNIKQGYHRLIHEFKLDAFHSILQNYQSIITTIEENPQLNEVTKIIKQKYKQANTMLQTLTPKTRQKRSIDILGKVIKQITGNLDNEDLVKLTNQITTLKNSNNLLINENNEQIRINEVFEKRINNLTKEAFRQSVEVSKFIKQARIGLDRSVDWQHTLHMHNIIFSLDEIRYQLDIFFSAIQLSRLGVISTALLQPKELELATHILQRQGVRIDSYDQAYEYLESAAFHHDDSIIILVKIPKLREGNYQMLRVEPIPIDAKVIDLGDKFAVINENESFLSNEKCVQIEKEFLCDEQKLKNVTDSQCYHPLLRGNPSSCSFNSHPNSLEINVIESNGVLIKNAIIPVQLQNTCGFGAKNLTGTFFITFDNCSIDIDRKHFDSKIFKFSSEPNILPLHFAKINKTDTNMEPMEQLQDLQLNNRHRINRLEDSNLRDNMFGIGTIVMIMLFIIVTMTYLTKEIQGLRKKTTVHPAEQSS